ncbi:MAG: rane protein insertase YidC, partial [Verrucomicrobiota bacterium]
MYDRKTWIVVITCSVLIAVNYWFMQKNAREAALRNPPPAVAPADPAAPEGEKPGVLEIVDPEPLEAATTHELRTAGARYTFTSLGGGLLTAE